MPIRKFEHLHPNEPRFVGSKENFESFDNLPFFNNSDKPTLQELKLMDSKLLCELGVRYIHGCLPGGKDSDFGINCLEISANKGHPASLYNLGCLYEQGLGVQQSSSKAFQCFKQAADKGSAEAMHNLGEMTFYGHGTEENLEKAAELLEKAVKIGDWRSCSELGDIYCMESDLQDFEKAIKFLKIGHEHGDFECTTKMGLLIRQGLGVPLPDPRKAFQLFEIAALQYDHGAAYYNLARMYHLGFEPWLPANMNKAIEFYKKAAELGEEIACLLIGNCYEGTLIEQRKTKIDMNEAFLWYSKGAAKYMKRIESQSEDDAEKVQELNNDPVKVPFYLFYCLGNMYLEGRGTKKDAEKAFKILKFAAYEGNEPNAQYLLSKLYKIGKGCKQNLEKSQTCLMSAAMAGHAQANAEMLSSGTAAQKEITQDSGFIDILSELEKKKQNDEKELLKKKMKDKKKAKKLAKKEQKKLNKEQEKAEKMKNADSL